MDRDTFLDRLRESRLLSDKQVGEIAGEFGDEPPQSIATSLISRGLLTPFQVKRLNEGQARGLILGQYRLLEEAGQGGFGRVYKGLHAVMGRVVAVKVISPQAAEETRARNWFKREVQAATQLYHPNIVMAYDANEAEGYLFLVMEYVDGSDLETMVKRQGPLPISLACEMMRQAARALQYASERGMVHRDVKPANLLVPRARTTPADGPAAGPGLPLPDASPVAVKVVDFGLARLHRPLTAQSQASQTEKRFLGTPDYVSPEQVRNASAVDVRSDLYSLGCTFYYALTGRKPFHGETVFEVIIKHLEEEPLALEAIRPEVPVAVAAVIRRLMAKDPARRFQTPAELIVELDFLCGKEAAGPAALAAPSGVVHAVRPAESPAPAAKQAERPAEEAGAKPGRLFTRFIPQLAVENRPAGSHPDTEEGPDEPAPAGLEGWDVGKGLATWKTVQIDLSAAAATPPQVGAVADEENNETLVQQSEAEGASATGDPAPAANGDLLSRWRQWVAVVEAFARGEGQAVDEHAYRLLHRELLDACRSRASAGGGPELLRLESLVEPWLSRGAFVSADRSALSSLLEGCRKVEQEVFGAGASWNLSRWVAFVVVALIAGVVGLYFRGPRVGAVPGKPNLAALWKVVEAYPFLSLAVVLPIVILLFLSLASRLLRG